MKIDYLTIILCTTIFIFTGCKKDGNTDVPEQANLTTLDSSLDFTYSGNLWVGDTINFKAISQGSNLRWYFGDGNSSLDNAAQHVFTQEGTYAISLVSSNNDTTTKSISIQTGAERFAGIKVWHGYSQNYGAMGSSRTNIENDTSEIILIDDNSVLFKGTSFHFYRYDQEGYLDYEAIPAGLTYQEIWYIPSKDSLHYFKHSGSSGGGTYTHLFSK